MADKNRPKLRGPFIVESDLDCWASYEDVERWAETGHAEALDGCNVDTGHSDRCQHGYPTWLLALGLKLTGDE